MWTFAKRAIIEDTISLSEIIISYVAVVGALALVRKSRTVDAEEVTSVSYEVRIYLRGRGWWQPHVLFVYPTFGKMADKGAF